MDNNHDRNYALLYSDLELSTPRRPIRAIAVGETLHAINHLQGVYRVAPGFYGFGDVDAGEAAGGGASSGSGSTTADAMGPLIVSWRGATSGAGGT